MRKIVIASLFSLMLFLLIGCDALQNETTTYATKTTQTTISSSESATNTTEDIDYAWIGDLLEQRFSQYNAYHIEPIYTVDGYTVYHFENANPTCEMILQYSYRDILFSGSSGCENTFAEFGFFAEKNDVIFTLEELGDAHIIEETTIATFLDFQPATTDISTIDSWVSRETDPSSLYFIYSYSDFSIYSLSIQDEVVPFLASCEFPTYRNRLSPYPLETDFPMIPKLHIYNHEMKEVATFVGTEILDFILLYNQITLTGDLETDESTILSILPSFDYQARYGMAGDFEIVFNNGVSQFAWMEIEYHDYVFSGNLIGTDFEVGRLGSIGLIALKDGVVYEIEDLVDNGVIDILDVIRLTAYFLDPIDE